MRTEPCLLLTDTLEFIVMSDYLLPRVENWEDWGAVFTDVALWLPVVARLWADNNTLQDATGIHEPGRLARGYPGTCAVFIVDEKVVVKFFPPMVVHDFDRERTVYRAIRDRVSSLPILLTEGVVHDRIDWPFLVFSFLTGEAWREVRQDIARAEQVAILEELGRIGRIVHETPLTTSGSWPSKNAWEALLDLRIRQVAADLRAGTTLNEAVIQEVMSLLMATDWSTAHACLVHADLTEDHLLVGRGEGRWSLTGLIDWADAEVSDPYYGLVSVVGRSPCSRRF